MNDGSTHLNKSQYPEFSNYEQYVDLTRSKNWEGICDINEVDLDSFGAKKELGVLSEYLEDDEVVFALTSGIMSQTDTSNSLDFGTNTWLVALTNERFLFLDHAMLTSSVDTQSVRHDSVQAVSASQGLLLGKIQVDLGARLIVIDNCQKATVKVIANLANKWLRVLQKQEKGNQGNGSNELASLMQENIKLARLQIKYQQKIAALLEEVRDNTSSK